MTYGMARGRFLVWYPIPWKKFLFPKNPPKNPRNKNLKKFREFYLRIFWGFFSLKNPKSPSFGLGIFWGFYLGIFWDFSQGFSGIRNPRSPSPRFKISGDFFIKPKMKNQKSISLKLLGILNQYFGKVLSQYL